MTFLILLLVDIESVTLLDCGNVNCLTLLDVNSVTFREHELFDVDITSDPVHNVAVTMHFGC